MNQAPIPLEEVLRAGTPVRPTVVGLPAPPARSDHRFPLTPEGAAMLVARGFRVRMEAGAAEYIHYDDAAYARCGVEICDRRSTLQGDIVIYLQAFDSVDARSVKRGALLLTFSCFSPENAEALDILLRRHVIALALDRFTDERGHTPFADILSEIAGRAALSVASSLLADSVHGKGILLGGVAGVLPCEVLVMGSGTAAQAAARAAMGLGAAVKIFDNNIYSLREALGLLGPGVIGSTFHPRTFEGALRTADIIVATDPRCGVFGTEYCAVMKRGAICFDLYSDSGEAFPSLPVVNLDRARPGDIYGSRRLCYVNAGSAVPRTVAMALTNTFVTMLDDLIVCDGVANALKLNGSLRSAAFLFLGKCVNAELGRLLGVRTVDINLFLQFT